MEEKLDIFDICKKLKLKFWQHPIVIFSFLAIIILLFVLFIASNFIINLKESVFLISFTMILLLIFGYLINLSLEKIIEASLMKSELIYIASHQLRTPLTVLNWTLESVKKNKKTNGGISLTKDNFQAIKDSSISLSKTISSFLDMSRIESGIIYLNTKTFFLDELVRKEASDFQKIAKMKNIKIEIDSPENYPPILADPLRIGMVIQNLLDNAIKYSSCDEKVTIKIEKNDGFLKTSIIDHGQGIPDEKKEFIFKKHYRATGAVDRDDGGVGIGLYLAKLIVTLSKGDIGFESEMGKGSVFWFTLSIKE